MKWLFGLLGLLFFAGCEMAAVTPDNVYGITDPNVVEAAVVVAEGVGSGISLTGNVAIGGIVLALAAIARGALRDRIKTK